MDKVIITAAITGSIHTPSMSPYLPITPQRISDEAVAAWRAGAAVVHVHVRDPETGKPSPRLDLFLEVATSIKKRCNVVVGTTTGGGFGMSVKQRVAVVPELKPELASFNTGSMNFGIFPLANRVSEFKFDWEKPFLESTFDFIFPNTFKTMSEVSQIMTENETKPECEVFDVGMINNVAHLIEQGVMKKPVYLQFVLGILGGLPASVDNLVFMRNQARERIGDFVWSVCAAGREGLRLGAVAMAMGGNSRIGMEDGLNVGKKQLATSNAEQVEKAVQLAKALGLEPATPDEAREILGLKGLAKVNF